MKAEIEAKFLNVDFDVMRDKLTELGAECEHPMRLMKRVAIENEFMRSGKDSFLRVRDEGYRTTVTYKQFDSLSVSGAKEIEVEVSDFNAMVAILEQSGLVPRSYQETKRENWRLGTVEIMLDEWPWLNPYLEIEGSSVASVKRVALDLNLEWNNAVFGDVMAAYRVQYPHLGKNDTLASVSVVKFGDPMPPLLAAN